MLVLHSFKILNLNLKPKDIVIRSFSPLKLVLSNFDNSLDLEDLEQDQVKSFAGIKDRVPKEIIKEFTAKD